LDGALVGAGSLKPIKATSSVKSSALKLNLLWDNRHPCHITKMKKKHCCSLITTLANDYHCHNQVVDGFIIQTKVSGRNLHFKTQTPRKS
jgi:hypothetical protein